MKKEASLYYCPVCHKVIWVIDDTNVPTYCCGQPMTKLVPKTEDVGAEKHVPVITKKGKETRVRVGTTPHPMVKEHKIEWIALETEDGFSFKFLNPAFEPGACFKFESDKILAAYEYCNIHGLWKAEYVCDKCKIQNNKEEK